MKIIKNLLFTLIFILFFNLSFSQQKTLYDKKVEGLTLQLQNAEEQKLKNLEEYGNSDYSKISKLIKTEFENWLSKSEFEKQENYKKRIHENNKRSFDSICYKILLSEISRVENYNNLNLEVGEYDAENEKFKIKIKIFKTEINETLEVKLAGAKEFKRNSANRSYERSSIIISKSSNQWYFNNNDLIPTLFDFNIYNKITSENNFVKDVTKDISNQLTYKRSLIFSTNQLKIKNENFSNLEFEFNRYNEEILKINEIKAEIYTYKYADLQAIPKLPEGFNRCFSENFRLPDGGRDLKGKVIVAFIVEKDGSLTDINVIGHIDDGIDQEVVRVLKNSPKWIAGELNGRKVRCSSQITYENN